MLTDMDCVLGSIWSFISRCSSGVDSFIDHTGPLARMQEHRAGLLGWRWWHAHYLSWTYTDDQDPLQGNASHQITGTLSPLSYSLYKSYLKLEVLALDLEALQSVCSTVGAMNRFNFLGFDQELLLDPFSAKILITVTSCQDTVILLLFLFI